MTQIHSHPMVRLFMLIAVAVLLVACGSILPALAQEPGGGQQPSDPPDNPPPGQTEGGLDVDVDIHTGRSDSPVWYTQWWMWAIGLGVFLIIVIALTRGRSSA